MENQADCVFCKIVAGDIPSYKIWESETHLAFLTPWGNTDGFSVVIPKQHAGSYLFEVDEQVMHSTIDAAKQVALQIDRAFEDVGRCGLIFEGFGVDHLHAKLSPMHGTGNMAEWRAIISNDMKDFYEQYPGYISSHDSVEMSQEKLEQIAEKIRSAKKDD